MSRSNLATDGGTATDSDLKAIYAYLRSIKPLKNAVPDPIEPVQLQK